MTATPDPETTATTQPSLPTLELPPYHGRTPVGMKTALTGAGTRISRAHGIDDRVVLVVEAKVRKAGHESTDDGLVYVENLKVIDLHELDRDQGSRLLSALRSTRSTGPDTPLPHMGEIGYTDASGVVLTPAEVAALRGDPIRTLLSVELTPAVIVLDDGTRMLWPEEFDENEPRPYVGENLGTDDDPLEVLEVLHTVTGEPLGAPAPDPVADEPEPVIDEELAAELGIVVDAAELDNYETADAWIESPFDDVAVGEGTLVVEIDNAFELGAGTLTVGWDDATDETAVAWETPAAPATPADDVVPTADDYRAVDTTIPALELRLAQVIYVDDLRRLLAAEQQGRGRGLKPRAGALAAIENRLAARLSAMAATAATVQDVTTW